ncbi:hypothetical protein JCM3765_004570, partial [Sporobolomyces pararoseus]
MGFTNGWRVIDRADAQVRQKASESDRKGKGRSSDGTPEERDIKERSRALVFDVKELRDGFSRITERLRAENEGKPIVIKIILDINSLAFQSYTAASQVIEKKKQLSPENRKLCYERLQAWLTYKIGKEYKSAVPEDCQVELEIHVDHGDNRETKKKEELQERYLKEAVKKTEMMVEAVLGLQAEEKIQTSCRKRRERKAKQREKYEVGQEARPETDEARENLDENGDVQMEDAGETREQVDLESKVSEVA